MVCISNHEFHCSRFRYIMILSSVKFMLFSLSVRFIVFKLAVVSLLLLFNIFISKLFYSFSIFIWVVLVRCCMVGIRNYPDLFWLWFGVIYLMNHVCRNKVIFVAMNEKHRFSAFFHLIYGRCFMKVPSVLNLANPACGI